MLTAEHSPPLAAIVYESGDGALVDEALSAVAAGLARDGLRLAGAIQRNTHGGDRCRCDMSLEDLASGRVLPISEYRGPHARGCRLDPAALEDAVGLAVAGVERGADLLIINKFGKREAEGRGFRQAVEVALALGTPVLTAVGRENIAAWRAFCGTGDVALPLDVKAVTAWCRSVARAAKAEAAS